MVHGKNRRKMWKCGGRYAKINHKKIQSVFVEMEVFNMFVDGFPYHIKKEYQNVIAVICVKTINNVAVGVQDGYNSENEYYLLSDGTKIKFPYRIYFVDDDSVYEKLTNIEKMIYDCIFTRSCDGHIREKHLINLLNTKIPEWCMPYILKISSEYVVEIIELIYDSLKNKDNTSMQVFCLNNPKLLKRAYQRMVSYWNEYYRSRYRKFNAYVGRKLFRECFAPKINFELL